MTTDDYLRQLLDAAREIGGIDECNGHYQYTLADRLRSLGTPLRDLTVGELLDTIQEHNDLQKRIYGGIT